MVGLQSWNDDPQTTHSELLARLERTLDSTAAQLTAEGRLAKKERA